MFDQIVRLCDKRLSLCYTCIFPRVIQKLGSCDPQDHLLLRMFCPYLISRFYGYICKVALGDKRNKWRHPRKPSYTARFIGDKVSFYVDIIGLSWWLGSWIKFRVTPTQHPDLTRFHVEPWRIPLQPDYLAHLAYMETFDVSLNNPPSPSSLPFTINSIPFTHHLPFDPIILTSADVVTSRVSQPIKLWKWHSTISLVFEL